jgi:DNA-binding PadR family transcriptional regulator
MRDNLPRAAASGWWGNGDRRMRPGGTGQLLLKELLDGPAHGYEIISRIKERSAGLWWPSAGSVYPALQLLESRGMVASHERGRKRVYELTDAGRAQVEQQVPGDMPWETAEGTLSGFYVVHGAMAKLQLAARQVAMVGDDAQMERAAVIIKEARQRLYELLAEDLTLAPALADHRGHARADMDGRPG